MHFGFATAQDIRFGRGTSKDAAHTAAAISKRALLVHGKSADRAAWLLDDLGTKGVTTQTIACTGEPDLTDIDAALAIARDVAPGVVIALGGGATIDMGKAIAALTPSQGPTLAYLEVVGEGRPLDAQPLPYVAIPTTAGTGAEVTKNAVIGVPEARKKVSLRDPRMIPDIAIVDPALSDNTPAHVTFSSGFDAITQVIEPFLSTKASPLTDALCRDAIPRGLNAIFRLAKGEDPSARDDMALTSLIGGIALANAGLGAVHGLAGIIGGRNGAPHGEVCAALLPHVLAFNATAVPQDCAAAAKMAEVEAWISHELKASPDQATRALQTRLTDLGIRSVGALGVTQDEIKEVAAGATLASSSKTNPVPLETDDFKAILQSAFAS
ncbi:MAG: iron-containing alcohol dehydrogenase [Pseudomonadota bacterium]